MLIACPICATSYAVDPILLGTAIRTVRCTRCKSTWIAGERKVQIDVIGVIAALIAKAEASGGGINAPAKCQSVPPPLQLPPAEGNYTGFLDQRRTSSWRYPAMVLSGAVLIAGIAIAVLESRTNSASFPELIKTALRGSLIGNESFGVAYKSDRLVPGKNTDALRQVDLVSRVMRAGGHQVMPLVRVAGSLALSVSGLSADSSPYSALRLSSESSLNSEPGKTSTSQADTDVAFVMRDMASQLPQLHIGPTAADGEAAKPVREPYGSMQNTIHHLPAAADVAGVRLASAATAGNFGPYENATTHSAPDNVTLLPKAANQTTGGRRWNERVIAVKKGDDVSSILRALDTTADEINSIIAVLGPYGRAGGISDGQELHVLLAPTAAGSRMQPVRVIIASGAAVEAAVALSDAGQYVAVDLHNIDTHAAENGEDRGEENDTPGISIYQSVLETARRNQIPSIIVHELFRIFSNDFDFQRNVQPGDNFELLFVDEVEKPSSVNRSGLLYAALTIGGETRKYYRYQSANEDSVDYYDESGKSAKRLLLRNPTVVGFVSSGFGLRRDPILGDTRMHTGVDLAAPTGTPIHASGAGVVKMIGWESGYGKYIRIGHTNRYETAYGHMSAFARGLRTGTRVRQGQVIGFVGSTGFSTGPHLHYEILADGRFVDPMRANLPRERVLLGPVLTSFEREREEVDNLNNDLETRPSLVAGMQPLAD